MASWCDLGTKLRPNMSTVSEDTSAQRHTAEWSLFLWQVFSRRCRLRQVSASPHPSFHFFFHLPLASDCSTFNHG